jgi:hypothetical protein
VGENATPSTSSRKRVLPTATRPWKGTLREGGKRGTRGKLQRPRTPCVEARKISDSTRLQAFDRSCRPPLCAPARPPAYHSLHQGCHSQTGSDLEG